jgi:hypothetical protein
MWEFEFRGEKNEAYVKIQNRLGKRERKADLDKHTEFSELLICLKIIACILDYRY